MCVGLLPPPPPQPPITSAFFLYPQMSLAVRQCTFTQRVSPDPLQVTGPWVRQPPLPARSSRLEEGPAMGEGLLTRNPSGHSGVSSVNPQI